MPLFPMNALNSLLKIVEVYLKGKLSFEHHLTNSAEKLVKNDVH